MDTAARGSSAAGEAASALSSDCWCSPPVDLRRRCRLGGDGARFGGSRSSTDCRPSSPGKPSSPPPSARAAAVSSSSFSRACRRLLLLPRAGSPLLPCGRCIRGERRCNFASPLSSEGKLPRALPPLLEGSPSMHSVDGEAKLHLHALVGVSLIRRCQSFTPLSQYFRHGPKINYPVSWRGSSVIKSIRPALCSLLSLPQCHWAQLLLLLLAFLLPSCELVAMSLPPPLMAMLLLAVAVVVAERVLAAGDDGGITAHPVYGDASRTCGPASAAPTAGVRQLAEYDGGDIFDITHAYRPELPGIGPDGLGPVVFQTMSMANGSFCNLSELRMVVHAGTHIDTPGHMIQEHFEAGLDADKLDLVVLNGPALLVDVPRNTNITAEAMEFLNIPKGVRRVLFRTLNTDRKLMWKKAGDFSYVGFTEDGAQWLVDNTDIKLVGVDYLSVAAFDHLISAHVVFFKHPDIIPVEGLKLDDVPAGIYNLHCLPLRLVGAEGSPVRCILIK